MAPWVTVTLERFEERHGKQFVIFNGELPTRPDEITEVHVELRDAIERAVDFEELERIVGITNGISSTEGLFTPDYLLEKIREVKVGASGSDTITRNEGLRGKVEELLQADFEPPSQGNLLMRMKYALLRGQSGTIDDLIGEVDDIVGQGGDPAQKLYETGLEGEQHTFIKHMLARKLNLLTGRSPDLADRFYTQTLSDKETVSEALVSLKELKAGELSRQTIGEYLEIASGTTTRPKEKEAIIEIAIRFLRQPE